VSWGARRTRLAAGSGQRRARGAQRYLLKRCSFLN
jgi:hypothetical protein